MREYLPRPTAAWISGMIGASRRMEGIGNNSSILTAIMRESRIVSPFGKRTAGTVYGGSLGLVFGVVFQDIMSAGLIHNTNIGIIFGIQRF